MPEENKRQQITPEINSIPSSKSQDPNPDSFQDSSNEDPMSPEATPEAQKENSMNLSSDPITDDHTAP